MTVDSEAMYWSRNEEWYRINKEKDCFELTPKATERARKSFEEYKRINQEHEEQKKKRRGY